MTERTPILQQLCRGASSLILDRAAGPSRLGLFLVCIIGGSGLYGASIGLWRAPLQALYALIKFPLLILLTCAGTSVLNWMLSILLGAKLSFKEVSRSMLLSYALLSVILGALCPISFFILYNTPPLEVAQSRAVYSFTLLFHVLAIAFAGLVSTSRLRDSLVQITGSRGLPYRLMAAWLLAHLIMGSQLSWNLRPFIGSPDLPIEFFRPDAFSGSFFEAVWNSIINLT